LPPVYIGVECFKLHTNTCITKYYPGYNLRFYNGQNKLHEMKKKKETLRNLFKEHKNSDFNKQSSIGVEVKRMKMK